jgi:hypothetical protein
VSPDPPVALRQIDVTTSTDGGADSGASSRAAADSADVAVNSASGRWRAQLRPRGRDDGARLSATVGSGAIACAVGDADEVAALGGRPPYANANVATLDLGDSTLKLTTSLTGLPPVFVLRQGSTASVSSPFIPQAALGALNPDLDGVADLLRWGHPLDGRTVFADLRVLPANSTVSISRDGALAIQSDGSWPELGQLAALPREAIVSGQVAAFADAARRLRTSGAFLSLSGGLDSRTALVALLLHGHRVPCVTMAGSRLSLDVRLAQAFCNAHGLEHHAVFLDDTFTARCVELIQTAAALTGGVSCLSQTADLFLYEALPSSFTTRISGNLGNQVGRGGFESLSAYRPRAEVFAEPVRRRLDERAMVPWFIPRLLAGDYGETIFSQEVPFWSTANYVAGSARALQLTPYADRQLMQLSRAAFARDPELRRPRWETLRARDLRHRLRGTPRSWSFQRQFLARYDSAGRKVPLNWGWRAAGGWSPRWFLAAMASATDAAMIKLSGAPGSARPAARWIANALGHRSALVDWRALIRGALRELTMDALGSRLVRESGVFEPKALQRLLEAHLAGEADEHYTVARSLEIALGMLSRASYRGSRPG